MIRADKMAEKFPISRQNNFPKTKKECHAKLIKWVFMFIMRIFKINMVFVLQSIYTTKCEAVFYEQNFAKNLKIFR